MNDIGKPERETQRRVIALFRDELGYRFLGDWTESMSGMVTFVNQNQRLVVVRKKGYFFLQKHRSDNVAKH